MSSRENYKPVTLRDVLWAGKEPAPAYAFTFVSKGRRYRCVTPKACSNFFVEDLGAHAPALQLTKTAPREVGLCGPIEVQLAVRNTGNAPATQVVVTDRLPAGWKTSEGLTELRFDAGTLAPGAAREFRFQAVAAAVGDHVNQAQALCAEGAKAEAAARSAVRAPVLALVCEARAEAVAGRPAQVCLTLRNTGSAPEPKATVTLPIPAGAVLASATEGGTAADGQVTWTIADLAAGASQQVCAAFTTDRLGELAFAATAGGTCAPSVQSGCATKFVGIPAVLLEVGVLEDPIEIDPEVTSEIRVVNQGFGALTNVRLTCVLPASQGFVSGSGTTPVRAQDGAVTMEPLPVLAPKAAASWRVVVKALKADDARFKVELRSVEFEQPVYEDESTRQY